MLNTDRTGLVAATTAESFGGVWITVRTLKSSPASSPRSSPSTSPRPDSCRAVRARSAESAGQLVVRLGWRTLPMEPDTHVLSLLTGDDVVVKSGGEHHHADAPSRALDARRRAPRRRPRSSLA